MPAVTIEITRFVNEFPGVVECKLIDAIGQIHTFIEKAPIVSDKNLCTTSNYPCLASIDCEIEDEWDNSEGKSLVKINTDLPWHVESTMGVHKFTVFSSQIVRHESDD
jgi:hypothetical protein